jgi:5-methylcytosine-specific restriction endonuclease McrA
MARKKKDEPWYYGYLRGYVRQLWQWSPVRKAVKKRAKFGSVAEQFKCEKCGAAPLVKGQYEINHIEPCENVNGFDGWDGFIVRTVEAPGGAELLCKPCHRTITNEQNKLRRENRGKKSGKVQNS